MMWLRLYSEARTDNKLRMLTDAQHRVWFNLLCYAGEQDERGVVACDRFLLAVECAGGDEALLAETVALLCRLGILADHDGTLRFAGWDRRQHDKPSDQREAAAERQRRSRASRDVTPLSRDVTPCHADVTPLSRDVTRCHAIDTDTDTETETETDTNGSLRSLPARARARASDDPPGPSCESGPPSAPTFRGRKVGCTFTPPPAPPRSPAHWHPRHARRSPTRPGPGRPSPAARCGPSSGPRRSGHPLVNSRAGGTCGTPRRR